MPAEPSERSLDPELDRVRRLARLMERYDLTAIDLGEGAHKIRLRRRASELPSAAPVAPVAGHAGPAPQAPSQPASPTTASGPPPTVIESPMVGTFYASSAPDSPAFVSVGSVVRPETTVCIIEAMKVFTEIPAGVSGTITDVLAKNGQAVEYGQPLFRVAQD